MLIFIYLFTEMDELLFVYWLYSLVVVSRSSVVAVVCPDLLSQIQT